MSQQTTEGDRRVQEDWKEEGETAIIKDMGEGTDEEAVLFIEKFSRGDEVIFYGHIPGTPFLQEADDLQSSIESLAQAAKSQKARFEALPLNIQNIMQPLELDTTVTVERPSTYSIFFNQVALAKRYERTVRQIEEDNALRLRLSEAGKWIHGIE